MSVTQTRTAGQAQKHQQQGEALNCLYKVRNEDVSEHD